MAEQEQNRSEPATPHKLQEAKKRGQVPKSLDFNTMVVVAALVIALSIAVGEQWQRLLAYCAALFGGAASWQIERVGDLGFLVDVGRGFLGLVLPIAAVAVIFGILGNVVQTGPVFSFEALRPQFERINPAAGLKRVFSKRMLFEAFKSLLKLALFVGVTISFFRSFWDELPSLEAMNGGAEFAWLGAHAFGLVFRLALALILVGLLDLLWSRRQFGEQMKMSRRELKEEVRRREGDPQVRKKIRELQRENLKQSSSIGRVREADVLITNPEHLAIALRYERGKMLAPVIVAKGADAWALEFKNMARRHAVPIVERRSLARKLFRHGQIDRAIPVDSYVDVARVYADLAADEARLAARAGRVQVHAPARAGSR